MGARDVSIGNILIYEGGAKLADLEYAKKVGSDRTPHNMRTVSESYNKPFPKVITSTGYTTLYVNRSGCASLSIFSPEALYQTSGRHSIYARVQSYIPEC